jgi:hypothetical protein
MFLFAYDNAIRNWNVFDYVYGIKRDLCQFKIILNSHQVKSSLSRYWYCKWVIDNRLNKRPVPLHFSNAVSSDSVWYVSISEVHLHGVFTCSSVCCHWTVLCIVILTLTNRITFLMIPCNVNISRMELNIIRGSLTMRDPYCFCIAT